MKLKKQEAKFRATLSRELRRDYPRPRWKYKKSWQIKDGVFHRQCSSCKRILVWWEFLSLSKGKILKTCTRCREKTKIIRGRRKSSKPDIEGIRGEIVKVRADYKENLKALYTTTDPEKRSVALQTERRLEKEFNRLNREWQRITGKWWGREIEVNWKLIAEALMKLRRRNEKRSNYYNKTY